MRLFSHEVVQEQWAEVDYHDNMSLIGRVQKGGHYEVMAIGSYTQEKDGYAEVAFVVHDDFHGQGIASHMLEFLEQIARENNFVGFVATVMDKNQAMLNVFQKRYPHAELTTSLSGDILVTMPFVDSSPEVELQKP
jgi:GNAT superfamily N-acetyltransferase